MIEKDYFTAPHRRPFFILAVFFCIGIITASFLNVTFGLLFAIAGALLTVAVILLRKRAAFNILISVFFLFIGMLAYKNNNFISETNILYHLPDKECHCFCIGTIANDPESEKTRFSNSKTSFILNIELLKLKGDWAPAEGKILVHVYDNRQSFKYADRLLLEGNIFAPDPPTNLRQFDYKKFLENEKIPAILKVSQKELAKKLELRSSPNVIKKYAFLVRHKLDSKIVHYMPPLAAEISRGILLGLRAGIPTEIEELFIKTGTMHIIAISGLNIGLVIVVFMFFLKILCVPRKPRFFLVLILLLFYVLTAGAGSPLKRAYIMAGVVLVGFILEREPDILNSLGIAAMGILLFWPNEIFSASFQLSFLCLFAIIYFTPKIETALNLILRSDDKFSRYLKKSVSVSVAAWIGTIPLVISYFNNISFLSIIANLVAVPLLFLDIIFATVFFLSPSGFLSGFWAEASSLTIEFLLKFLSFLSAAPFGFYKAASWSIGGIIGFYLFLIVIFNFRRFKLRIFHLASGALIILNIFVWLPVFRTPDGIMKIYFFDVGFADGILIEMPNGGYALLDGGSSSGDCGRRIIAPYLWNKHIKRLDAVILSHPDADHFGGLEFILENFEIGAVFDNGQKNESFVFEQYQSALEKEKIKNFVVSESQAICGFKAVTITILHPPAQRLKGTGRDVNNNSVVLKIGYKDFSMLFTGDIQAEGLRYLLGYDEELESDVIKLPHHGLETSTEMEVLLDEVKPQIAVISAGDDKKNKIRQMEKILAEKNIEFYNTADSGFITIQTAGDDFEMRGFKSKKTTARNLKIINNQMPNTK